MKSLHFNVVLDMDVVISERSATTGGHSSLSYLPGACFLGACAVRLYTKLGTKAFDVFHSGAVRFGNAYPIDDEGYPTLPIPLSWHYPKGSASHEGTILLTDNVFNLVHLSSENESKWKKDNVQPKQMREGFFSDTGTIRMPTSSYRLKTAIDRTKGGRAKESQLFGYESLDAGSNWYFSIDFDDEVSPRVLEDISEALTKGHIRIGRSKSAEYGSVDITAAEKPPYRLRPGMEDGVFIYCLSDIALRDPLTGAPTLTPLPTHFGLKEDAQLSREETFIRTRSYTPFNSKRKAHDFERQVVCMGSVIAFRTSSELTQEPLEELQDALDSGIGMYKHDGLGKVLVNPSFLSTEHFEPAPKTALSQIIEVKAEQVAEVQSDQEMLLGWLDSRMILKEIERESLEMVEQWLKVLVPGVRRQKRIAPGKSQWGQLRDVAIRSTSIGDIETALFNEDKGLCTSGISKDAWKTEFYYDNGYISFALFLENVVLKTAKDKDHPGHEYRLLQRVIYLLGNQMPQKLSQEEA